MLAAAPPPPPLTAWPTVPVTDGRSYAVWSAVPRYSTHLAVNAVRVLRDDQTANPDAASTLAAPRTCELRAASRSAIGFWCHDDVSVPAAFREWPVLQDPATGATTTPPGADAIGDETSSNRANNESWGLSALGTAAAEIWAEGNHVSVDEVRALDGTSLDRYTDDPRRVLSLDAPGGSVRLCAPLILRDGNERATAQYRPPWLLSVRDGRLRLRHCGSHRVRALDDVEPYAPVLLTARYAAWSEPGAVHLRRLGATTRTQTFPARRLVPASSNENPLNLSGTDHRLWAGDDTAAVMLQP